MEGGEERGRWIGEKEETERLFVQLARDEMRGKETLWLTLNRTIADIIY